ncbi:hypothetical protein V6N12_035905 [Hibiscus sabdariffa]|uniref:Uncharacterized protein n=1 Tax=Hibiscus sabdariffa TaxID=183260 RepID=A0ABR2EPI6_9ROSI
MQARLKKKTHSALLASPKQGLSLSLARVSRTLEKAAATAQRQPRTAHTVASTTAKTRLSPRQQPTTQHSTKEGQNRAFLAAAHLLFFMADIIDISTLLSSSFVRAIDFERFK